jgi:hypothetical protein
MAGPIRVPPQPDGLRQALFGSPKIGLQEVFDMPTAAFDAAFLRVLAQAAACSIDPRNPQRRVR